VAEPARRKRDEAAPPARKLVGVRGTAAGRALDALIHHRLRLGIVSALAAADALTFNELKALLDTTDGNLSVHARKLEDAQYIACTKTFEDRRPRSEYRITAQGRRELQRYLDHMEALIHATRSTLER